jgi:hypothetical protein
METHPPHEPAHSWGDLFRQLAIITVGVLIALAFDGVVSWAEHRRLVREATNNLRSEMADNVRELEGLFTNVDKTRRSLEHAADLAQMLIDHRKVDATELKMELNNAELKDASRTTAEVTGAFGHMDYAEVERVASVYGLQQAFNRAQERANESFVNALSGAALLANPDKADPDLARQWKTQINLTIAALTAEEQVGQALLKRYSAALEVQ